MKESMRGFQGSGTPEVSLKGLCFTGAFRCLCGCLFCSRVLFASTMASMFVSTLVVDIFHDFMAASGSFLGSNP
jgi:hypothetical protein